MSRCYAIIFIDVATRKIVRAHLASAYPVAQADLGVVQVKVYTSKGEDYAAAYTNMRKALTRPDRKWFVDIAGKDGIR